MRRFIGVTVAAALLGLGCGSARSRCQDIPVGTPVSQLPVLETVHACSQQSPCGYRSRNPALWCCANAIDAGTLGCDGNCAGVSPPSWVAIGGEYVGGTCSDGTGRYECFAWVQEGRVTESQAVCSD